MEKSKFLNHFCFLEFFRNCSNDEILDALESPVVCSNLTRITFLLEYIRRCIGVPVIVNSGYRNSEHNKRVGGVPTSQHLVGAAADVLKSVKLCELFNRHRDECKDLSYFLHTLDIYQLIEYDRFYHISIYDDKHNRDVYPSVYIDKSTKIIFPED